MHCTVIKFFEQNIFRRYFLKSAEGWV